MDLKRDFQLKIKGLYLITDDRIPDKELFRKVKIAVKSGVGIVQLRDKLSSDFVFLRKAQIIKKICDRKCLFIINDRVDIAYLVNADGVHLGQDDIPVSYARKILKNKIIGISVDNLFEAKKAEKEGADYISIGPVYKTKTKKDVPPPCGVDVVKKLKEKVKIPVVAVGGINGRNIKDVISTGCDAFAISSYIMQATDVEKRVLSLIKILKQNT